jgi:hypothetical protein
LYCLINMHGMLLRLVLPDQYARNAPAAAVQSYPAVHADDFAHALKAALTAKQPAATNSTDIAAALEAGLRALSEKQCGMELPLAAVSTCCALVTVVVDLQQLLQQQQQQDGP